MAVGDISGADKIRNAATMFGTGSKQHKAAQARFGGAKKEAAPKLKRVAPGFLGARGGSSSKGRSAAKGTFTRGTNSASSSNATRKRPLLGSGSTGRWRRDRKGRFA